jgi:hypothetical protein
MCRELNQSIEEKNSSCQSFSRRRCALSRQMSGREKENDKDKKDDTPIVPLDEADITILKTYVRAAVVAVGSCWSAGAVRSVLWFRVSPFCLLWSDVRRNGRCLEHAHHLGGP